MKIKIAFFTIVMAMALTLPTFAQITPAPDSLPKPQMKQQDMSNMMDKPTFEATSGDLHFSIWIIAQEEHKKMMAEMSEKGMGMDDATKEAMLAGSHHFMVEVKNIASGKETKAISAKVEIVSPTNKDSSVELIMPVMNKFGSGLTLDEIGEYQLIVSVLSGNVTETIKLKYTVM